VRQFLWIGLRLGACGAIVGLIVALGVGRLMAALLYGVEATDPLAFGGAFMLVLALTLFASLIPAGRAAHIEPHSTLHHH
jgi:ABC-type lipoprotein release transport system permease subunit